MLALLSSALCVLIDRLTYDNLYKQGEDIVLKNSYSHGLFYPLFTTTIIDVFNGSLNGNGNTVSNIRIQQQNNIQSIFGYCNKATIQNISFSNVTFERNGVTSSSVAVLASHATDTVFKNININVEGDLNIEQDFSVICNQCQNITLENVTITSFHLSTNLTGDLNLFKKIQNSVVNNINTNMSIQFLKVSNVNLIASQSQNTAYNKLQIYGSHEIFDYTSYSMMFQSSQSDNVQNAYYNQQVTLFSTSKSNNLFGQNIQSSTSYNQVQFVVSSNEPFNAQVTATIKNTGYFSMTVTNPASSLIQLNIENQTELDNFYKNFSDLNKTYYLNNNGLYVIGDPAELRNISQTYLCANDTQCLNGGTCVSTSTGINSLGVIMHVFSCKCTDSYYGTHCENQIQKNGDVCTNGNRGVYCTVCNISMASVKGTCQPNCIIHNGYDKNYTQCVQCQQNYTGTHCENCNTGYIQLNTTCFTNIGDCQPVANKTQCQSCNSNNYTGSLCNNCSSNYKFNSSSNTCYFDYNYLCLTTGGYNLDTSACRECPVNSNGQICLSQSTPNATLCLMHGGYYQNNNTCIRCQVGYTGPLCQSCSQGYVKKGDYCVPTGLCSDNLFQLTNNICQLKYNCSQYGGLDFNLMECRKCTNNLAQPFCLKCKHMYELKNGVCECQGNYTGVSCTECQTGYYKYQEIGKTQYSCYLDQRNRCLPSPYNPIIEKCKYCMTGKTGAFCDQCAPYASGNNCQTIDYSKLCQAQNASYIQPQDNRTGKCSSCLKQYYGDLCDQCNGQYKFNNNNTECVQNVTTFCNIYLNQAENDNGLKLGHCNKCLYNTTGVTCQSCITNNFVQQYNSTAQQLICMINQSDPVNKIPAAIVLQCQVHGGVTDNLECRRCQRGFSEPYCLNCSPGFYKYNETLCKQNNSQYCTNHGGWDPVDNKCKQCLYGTGDFCSKCIDNSSYYSTNKYMCEPIQSYVDNVNKAQIQEKKKLIIVCIVIAVVILLAIIALILTIVLCKKKAAERERNNSTEQTNEVRHEQSVVAVAHLNNQTSGQLVSSENK